MKKLNKKGFTLVELLAVIVVLAIIMVIAAGSIMNTISNTRRKSFKSTLDVIVNDIKTNITLATVGNDSSIECVNNASADNYCNKMYDISTNDYEMSIEKKTGHITSGAAGTTRASFNDGTANSDKIYYKITLTGKGKFSAANMELTSTGNCPVTTGNTIATYCSNDNVITAYVLGEGEGAGTLK